MDDEHRTVEEHRTLGSSDPTLAGSWIKHIGEPLCPTPEEAEHYLTVELARAIPEGWTMEHISGLRPAWRISKDVVPEDEWPNQEYDVSISAGLDLVIFTHGNKDVGPFGIYHVLQSALVIDAAALRQFGVAACINRLFAECRPNEWGYT